MLAYTYLVGAGGTPLFLAFTPEMEPPEATALRSSARVTGHLMLLGRAPLAAADSEDTKEVAAAAPLEAEDAEDTEEGAETAEAAEAAEATEGAECEAEAGAEAEEAGEAEE
jgi:hypothetical protein